MTIERYTVFDQDGWPTAHYSSDVHGNNIPPEAIQVTEAMWLEMVNNGGRRKLQGGQIVPAERPIKTSNLLNVKVRQLNAQARQRFPIPMKTSEVRVMQKLAPALDTSLLDANVQLVLAIQEFADTRAEALAQMTETALRNYRPENQSGWPQ